MNQLGNKLRVKITGLCNLKCTFCHREGGIKNIDEIRFTSEFGKLAEKLYNDFSINTIAITGGEPLLHSNLELLILSIKLNTSIKNFSLTTNGSIEKDLFFWSKLKEYGLYQINISISDIYDSKNCVGTSNISIFDNQLKTIMLLNQIDIVPTINIVVYKDLHRLLNLLNVFFRQQNIKFNIALLPDLTNSYTFEHSQNIITEALKIFGCKEVEKSYRKGTSNMIYDYITLQSNHLQVKTTKPNGNPKWLTCLCNKCNYRENCQEGFYGIRVESINNHLMVRLCVHTSNSHVLLPVDKFFDSNVYSELKTIWKSNEETRTEKYENTAI